MAHASPFGTTYTATTTNFPGTAIATLRFDGLEEPLGSSGLLVRESSTTFAYFELIEFSLRPANGDPFVGQELAPAEAALAVVTDLYWFGDTTPAEAIPASGFLWFSIEGVPQALSDRADRGLVFGTHPLDESIQVLRIDNGASTTLSFSTLGSSTFDGLAALVGPTLAAQIDGVHLGVAAAPVPEPGPELLMLAGLVGLVVLGRARSVRRLR